MPSHLIHGALTQMHHESDGAPWTSAAWNASDSSQFEAQVTTSSFNLGIRSDGTDPGVEVESTIPALLSQDLEFVDDILVNTGGVTPCDEQIILLKLEPFDQAIHSGLNEQMREA